MKTLLVVLNILLMALNVACFILWGYWYSLVGAGVCLVGAFAAANMDTR